MTKSRRTGRSWLFRQLWYFAILFIGGSGAGGYAFQNHPLVQSIWNLFVAESADEGKSTADGSLVTQVVDALRPRESLSGPGLYQVKIAKVELDQKLFRPGHTVDIQARVHKTSGDGRETTLWDAKEFGSRLAVVGKDALTAGWPDRPFQVEWKTGDQLVLEVYDARTLLFIQPRRLVLARADETTADFPFKSGDFPLAAAQKSDSPVDPRANHVVLKSERVGDLRSGDRGPTQIAERPIVIK